MLALLIHRIRNFSTFHGTLYWYNRDVMCAQFIIIIISLQPHALRIRQKAPPHRQLHPEKQLRHPHAAHPPPKLAAGLPHHPHTYLKSQTCLPLLHRRGQGAEQQPLAPLRDPLQPLLRNVGGERRHQSLRVWLDLVLRQLRQGECQVPCDHPHHQERHRRKQSY